MIHVHVEVVRNIKSAVVKNRDILRVNIYVIKS